MNSDSKFFKLGLFVIVGVLLLVAGVVVLGAGEFFTHYVTVETATPQSVEGLDVGAAVKFSGVTVGKVSKIEMAMWKYPSTDPAVMAQTRRWVWIQMSVRRDLLPAKSEEEMKQNLDTAIQNGLRVRMASSGLTGPTFLEISYLNPQQYPVQAIPWEPEQLYVPAAPASSTQIVDGVESILTELRSANLGQTLADGRKFLVDTDTTINNLQVDVIQKKAVGLIDDADASARRIRDIVNDPKIQKMINDLSQTSASAAPSAQELQRVLRTLNEILDTRERDLETIITELRNVLQNGDSVVEDAKDNPSRLLFGDPPPRLDMSASK